MPTKKQLLQMEDESVTVLYREPCALQERSLVLLCPACIMSSLAPCLHKETDTRMFACTTEAA